MSDKAGPGAKLAQPMPCRLCSRSAARLVIAFVFVPFFSPDTDRVTAFVASFVFMVLTIAATYAVKRP